MTIEVHVAVDTLAEWLRRRPAKPMGSPCVGSNPTGVDIYFVACHGVSGAATPSEVCDGMRAASEAIR